MRFLSAIPTVALLLFLTVVLPRASSMACAAEGPVTATETDEAMRKMAKNLATVLSSLGRGQELAVGEFKPKVPQSGATGGKGLTKRLIEHLEQQGIRVQPVAELGFSGEFGKDTDNRGRPVVRITGQIVDEAGRTLTDFTQEAVVTSPAAVAATLGLTFDTPADETGKKQAERIQKAAKKPAPGLQGTRISASAKSPFAIEIRAGRTVDAVKAVTPHSIRGLAFVELAESDIYSVGIFNNSPNDVAVTLTIDGLSAFEFSEFRNQYRFFVIPAGQQAEIPGWHRTNEVSDAFQITEYSKSAAGKKLADGGRLGTVTVTFAACWEVGAEPPADEVTAKLKRSRGESLATGRGPEVEASYQEVRREFGRTRAAISVRYSKP